MKSSVVRGKDKVIRLAFPWALVTLLKDRSLSVKSPCDFQTTHEDSNPKYIGLSHQKRHDSDQIRENSSGYRSKPSLFSLQKMMVSCNNNARRKYIRVVKTGK